MLKVIKKTLEKTLVILPLVKKVLKEFEGIMDLF